MAEAGITTERELRDLGPAGAYRRLKHWDPKRVSLNMLWGLYGALNGVPWAEIDAGTRARLLAEVGETDPRTRRSASRRPRRGEETG